MFLNILKYQINETGNTWNPIQILLCLHHNSHVAFKFAALSITAQTTFSFPTNVASPNILKTLLVVFGMQCPMNTEKLVPLGLFTKKLQIECLFISIQIESYCLHPLTLFIIFVNAIQSYFLNGASLASAIILIIRIFISSGTVAR